MCTCVAALVLIERTGNLFYSFYQNYWFYSDSNQLCSFMIHEHSYESVKIYFELRNLLYKLYKCNFGDHMSKSLKTKIILKINVSLRVLEVSWKLHHFRTIVYKWQMCIFFFHEIWLRLATREFVTSRVFHATDQYQYTCTNRSTVVKQKLGENCSKI